MGIVRRLGVLAAIGGLALGFGATGANAATTSTTAPALVRISGNYAFSSAVITGPGMPTPRTLNAYQSAVFVQSWIGDLYVGKPVHQSPPPQLPVYEVDVTGNWGGSLQTRAVFYASNGSVAWVAFPPLAPLTTPTAHRPAITGWFVAPPIAIAAFAGRGQLQPTGGTETPTAVTTTPSAPTTTTPTTKPVRAAASGSSVRPVLLWLAIALAVAAIGSVAVSWFRARGGGPPSTQVKR